MDGTKYTTDFVCQSKDGKYSVFECVYRKQLDKPKMINEAGQLVGRPTITVCVDAYSGLCCGYSLGWEGGNFALRNLMQNIISDKVAYCRGFGIEISEADWNCKGCLPGKFITDKGSEYASENFSQLTELGIVIENLQAYRAECVFRLNGTACTLQREGCPLQTGSF